MTKQKTRKEKKMILRDALKASGWENFKNSQNEIWHTDDLLLEILPGESPTWLDRECTVAEFVIIDCEGDELEEYNN